ncbi:DUF2849 domain-containing protein [soil metagenome]
MSGERLQAITANDLREGCVVFRAGDGWTAQLADADFYGDPTHGESALELAKGETTRVVDVYLIDLSLEGGQPVPLSYRERIRALGPPVHPDLGKQAKGGPAIEAIAHATGGARSSGRLSLIKRK